VAQIADTVGASLHYPQTDGSNRRVPRHRVRVATSPC